MDPSSEKKEATGVKGRGRDRDEDQAKENGRGWSVAPGRETEEEGNQGQRPWAGGGGRTRVLSLTPEDEDARGVESQAQRLPQALPGAPRLPAGMAGTSTFVYSGKVTDFRDPSKLPRAESHCSLPDICGTPPCGQQTLPVRGRCQLSPPTHGQQRQPKESRDLLPPPSTRQQQQPLATLLHAQGGAPLPSPANSPAAAHVALSGGPPLGGPPHSRSAPAISEGPPHTGAPAWPAYVCHSTRPIHIAETQARSATLNVAKGLGVRANP